MSSNYNSLLHHRLSLFTRNITAVWDLPTCASLVRQLGTTGFYAELTLSLLLIFSAKYYFNWVYWHRRIQMGAYVVTSSRQQADYMFDMEISILVICTSMYEFWSLEYGVVKCIKVIAHSAEINRQSMSTPNCFPTNFNFATHIILLCDFLNLILIKK